VKKEVRLVKDYLRSEFPDDKFFVKVLRAQYCNSPCDKLEVVTRLPYFKVHERLKNVVSGVAIFQKGGNTSQESNTEVNILGCTETAIRAIEIVVL